MTMMLQDSAPRVLPQTIITLRTKIYFFENKNKHGIWRIDYVREAKEHFVVVTQSEFGRGNQIQSAYEDIKLNPYSSLLQEIDDIDMTEQLYEHESTHAFCSTAQPEVAQQIGVLDSQVVNEGSARKLDDLSTLSVSLNLLAARGRLLSRTGHGSQEKMTDQEKRRKKGKISRRPSGLMISRWKRLNF